MKQILLLASLLFTQILVAGNFDRFLSDLTMLPAAMRQARVDSFLKANPVVPYFENNTTVVFMYSGNATNAVIAGDMTGWEPAFSMTRVDGTDFFYKILYFEADARLEYKLVIDGKWMLDPKNPRSFTGGTGVNSEIRMPGYVVPPEILWYPGIPHGTFHDTSFFSKKLKNTRPVKIYLPSGYSAKIRYPVIVFHDGLEFITLANMANILDYLIARHQIEPLIGVFVPPVDRPDEYYGSKKDAYASLIVKEIIPVIDRRYSTSKDPRKRATIGISAGGNIALFIGMKHPETFGKIAALSSSVEPEIAENFRQSEKMNLEFYLDRGKYDLPMLIPMVDNLYRILLEKKYVCQFKVWHEGHSWGNWETHARLALQQFFPIK